jgi:hypothetical protein
VAPAAHAGVCQVWSVGVRCKVCASSVLQGIHARRQRAFVAVFVRLTVSTNIGSSTWQCGARRKVVPSFVCLAGGGGDRRSFAAAATAGASLALLDGFVRDVSP